RIAEALSRSPSASVSARLQSMKPAPVRSRSSLTRSAVMSAIWVRSPVSRRAPRPAGLGVGACLDRLGRPGGCQPAWASGGRGAAGLVFGRSLLVVLLGRLAGKLGGDLLGRGFLGCLGDGGLGPGDPVAGQQVVVLVGIRLEREGRPAGQRGDELL